MRTHGASCLATAVIVSACVCVCVCVCLFSLFNSSLKGQLRLNHPVLRLKDTPLCVCVCVKDELGSLPAGAGQWGYADSSQVE